MWTYEELVEVSVLPSHPQMVERFKRTQELDSRNTEMYDDGVNYAESPREEIKDEAEYDSRPKSDSYHKNNFQDDADYPNIDSPKLSVDFRKARTLNINKKFEHDSDEDYNVGTELEPEITNKPNLVMEKKESSSTNQGEYEVIGETLMKYTLKQKKLSEDDRLRHNKTFTKKVTTDLLMETKTDKGFSEISKLK